MRKNGLTILTFHALADGDSPIFFPPRLFQEGLHELARQGFRSIDLVVAVEALRKGQTLPPRSYVLSFDDGYHSIWEKGFPVLDELGITATVFLSTGTGGFSGPERRPVPMNGLSMLSTDEMRVMRDRGIRFGAHTLNHPDLTLLPSEQAEAELLGSKRIIENALQTEVDRCAYPFGLFNQKTRSAAARHFKCACSDRLGFVYPGDDPFSLRRVDAFYLRAPWGFRMMASGIFPYYIKGRALPRAVRRYVAGRMP